MQLWVLCVDVHVRPRPNFFGICDYKGYATALTTGDFSSYNSLTTGSMITWH